MLRFEVKAALARVQARASIDFDSGEEGPWYDLIRDRTIYIFFAIYEPLA